jgi:hypothetical protein
MFKSPSAALTLLALASLVAACGGGGGGSSFVGSGGGGGSSSPTPAPTQTATPTTAPTTLTFTTSPQSCPSPGAQANYSASGGVVANPTSLSFSSVPGVGSVMVSEAGSVGPFTATVGNASIAAVNGGASQTLTALSAGGQVTFNVTMTCNGNTTLTIVDTSHSGANAVVPMTLTVITGVISSEQRRPR